MNIIITGRKTTVKDSFKEAAEKQLAKFDRLFDRESDANILVSNENGREIVEITIRGNGMIFRTEKTAEDRLTALDAAADTLFKQFVKHKSKLEKKFKQPVAPEFFAEAPEVEELEYRLVKSKHFAVKPMEAEEAILQMEMLGHSFYMFENAVTGSMNVVYRRNDGGYGLIEPEE